MRGVDRAMAHRAGRKARHYRGRRPGQLAGTQHRELDIRRKYGVNILGVRRNNKTDVNISPETVLDSSLTLLVLGEYTVLKKCFRL